MQTLSYTVIYLQTNLLTNSTLAGASVLTRLARNTDVINVTSRLLYSTSSLDKHVTHTVWTRHTGGFWRDAWVHTADIRLAAFMLNGDS